jgi:hypothetical protein
VSNDESKEPGVSTRQIELVLRRAAELEAPGAAEGSISERDVKQLAGEIGISSEAVERALVELRSGALEVREQPRGLSERLWGPAQLVCVRTVPGSVERVEAKVADFLRSQAFTVKRNLGAEKLWRRERSVLQSLRAAIDTRRQKLEGCSEITSVIEPTAGDGDGAVRVILRVGLDELRGSARANAWAGSLLMGGGAAGAGVLAGTFAALFWIPVGGVAAAAIVYGWTRAAVSGYRDKVIRLEENVEGFLDHLEHERRALPP